jgi:hypothetical protein
VTGDEPPVRDPLRHHGNIEAGAGLLDFAVNVYAGNRPAWLDPALHAAIDQSACYPDAGPARAAVARRHGRGGEEVLATAGAAEAFTLIARLRAWRRPAAPSPASCAGRQTASRSSPGPSPVTPTSWSSATRSTRPACCTRPRSSGACFVPADSSLWTPYPAKRSHWRANDSTACW